MSLKRIVLRLHRWLGVTAGAVWLLQAMTGLSIVFHWELSDAQVPGAHRATDLDKLGERIAQLESPGTGQRVVSVWTTAGAPDRYDITVQDRSGRRQAIRVAGDGTVLRTRDKAARDFMDMLVAFHQTLLAGDLGQVVVGASGALLLSNIGFGLWMAWPRAGAWRRTLRPPSARGPAFLFNWHRAVGFWLAAPAIVTVCAGALLAFEDPLRAALHAQAPSFPATMPSRSPIPFADAVRAAHARLPGSRLTTVQMPSGDNATYRIRLLAPGESRRAYGLSVVFVDANSGKVRQILPAWTQGLATRLMDLLYSIHTGEALGLAGRLLNSLVAIWLLATVGLGGMLWSRRRSQRLVPHHPGSGVRASER